MTIEHRKNKYAAIELFCNEENLQRNNMNTMRKIKRFGIARIQFVSFYAIKKFALAFIRRHVYITS